MFPPERTSHWLVRVVAAKVLCKYFSLSTGQFDLELFRLLSIQLIERFYDPLAGEVLLDGQNISELNVQEYRKNIALVSQEPTLYAGTIKFNILLGAIKPAEQVTQEELEAACRDANILDFIRSLPEYARLSSERQSATECLPSFLQRL